MMAFVAIIGDLLPGLGSIELGSTTEEDGTTHDYRREVSGVLDAWPALQSEIIGNMFVTRLVDLCREADRDPRFLDTPIALKIRDEMNWIRRAYFLPHLTFHQTAQVDSVVRKDLPRMAALLGTLKRVLARTAKAIDTTVKQARQTGRPLKELPCSLAGNPWDPMSYEIPNQVTRRLEASLRQPSADASGQVKVVDRRNNANLVFHLLSLVLFVEHLLTDRESFYYKQKPGILFRSHDGTNERPNASVDLMETEELLERALVTPAKLQHQLQSLRKRVEKDELTGLVSGVLLEEDLAKEVSQVRSQNLPLSAISLDLTGFKEYNAKHGHDAGDAALKRVGALLGAAAAKSGARAYRVKGDHFVMVLPGVAGDQALAAAQALTRRFSAGQDAPGTVPVAAHFGVVDLQDGWGPRKLLAAADKARLAAQSADRLVGYLNSSTGRTEVAGNELT